MEQLSTSADPMIARSDCVVPFVSDLPFTSHVEDDDACMMCFDGLGLEPSIWERNLSGYVSGFFILET